MQAFSQTVDVYVWNDQAGQWDLVGEAELLVHLVPLADPFEHFGLPELPRLDQLGDELVVRLLAGPCQCGCCGPAISPQPNPADV